MQNDRKFIDSRVCRNPQVTYRDLEEGGVLLHLESGAYHGLNRTGSVIWKLLGPEPTLPRLIEQVRESFEDPPQTIADEVADFVAGMSERDLIRLRKT